MNDRIFRDSEVYNSLPEYLFCNVTCKMRPIKICKSCSDVWFSAPPKYTTIRVNPLVTSVQKVAAIINKFLYKEAEKQGLPLPNVYQHNVLQDCLVVSPWHYQNDRLNMTKHVQEVIVDAACGSAVLRGANVFAPGVLGMLPSIQEGDMVSVYADSAGQCKRGLKLPFTDPGKVFVGNGVVKMSRKFLFGQDPNPKGVAVEIIQPASEVVAVNIPLHLGLLQNLPSIVCSHVLSPQPGDKVIDLCAAPGHKTTHLATLMSNKGLLVALDKISEKIEGLKSLCRTMHIDCVKAFTFDSTKAVSSSPGTDWSPPYVADTFNRVLLDAPCSGLGQRPQISNKISNKMIASYPKLQKKLFATAVQLLRPGGCLVYSTCSLTTEENENLISWALHKYPQLNLVPALPLLGKSGHPQSSLSEAECQRVQRFGPPIGHMPEEDTIGFFIAKFIKIN